MISDSLLSHAREKARRLFKRNFAPGHDFGHVCRVVDFARRIAEGEGGNVKLAELAGWLHDIGRIPEQKENPRQVPHQELSFDLAGEWFEKDRRFRALSAEEKKEILYAVRNHGNDSAGDYLSAVILRDADKCDLWGPAGLKRHLEYIPDGGESIKPWLAVQILRFSRLRTKTARRLAKEGNLLAPLKEFLRSGGKKRLKALAAISGGVDSAVAAALLKKAGFEVTGAFIKCYGDGPPGALVRPCWIEDKREATRVAAKLGIKLLVFDFEKEFRREVVDYLFREYRAGKTPNPDVICNKKVKIPLLIREAKKRGFDCVATGHYARLRREIRNPKPETRKAKLRLLKAVDENKDQSYFLHQLKREHLKYLLFPLGFLTKNEVRVLAKEMNLPVAEREESMGICFIGETPMKDFLKSKIKTKKGDIIASGGRKIGEHEGAAFYTIGQRIGGKISNFLPAGRRGKFQISNFRPWYVVGKNIKKNLLIAGCDEDPLLYARKVFVGKVNWIAGQKPELPLKCQVRLRHRHRPQEAAVKKSRRGVKLIFKKPQKEVTPGQFAVFYQKDECLGGGVVR